MLLTACRSDSKEKYMNELDAVLERYTLVDKIEVLNNVQISIDGISQVVSTTMRIDTSSEKNKAIVITTSGNSRVSQYYYNGYCCIDKNGTRTISENSLDEIADETIPDIDSELDDNVYVLPLAGI